MISCGGGGLDAGVAAGGGGAGAETTFCCGVVCSAPDFLASPRRYWIESSTAFWSAANAAPSWRVQSMFFAIMSSTGGNCMIPRADSEKPAFSAAASRARGSSDAFWASQDAASSTSCGCAAAASTCPTTTSG